MMKKTLSLILALVMILGSFGVAFAEGEATPAAPAAPAAPADAAPAEAAPAAPVVENAKVKWLQESGLVKGYADGSLGLDKTITRAEFAAILVRGMGMEDEAMKAMAIPSKFVDMGGHWANGYVEVAVGNGLVKGYPNMTFRPNAQITYAEVVAMLVRATKSINAMEEISAVWPNTYIVKAAQAGILQNTLIGDYNTAAVREKAFELIYNAMHNANLKAFGNNSVVKAIVLENDRVESIGKNEIVIEYMKVLQESDYVNAVRKSGDLIGKQEKFELDEKVGDVEELLGKVVDFTIDRNGKLIKATVDTTYQYLMGYAEAGYRTLKIDGKAYTVEQREQYNKTEDRLYRTYFNGDDMRYTDFYKLDRDSDVFECEFARVTVKNGKVVFIDAYDFEDIAPVKETKNGGNDVYFYNDTRDGKVDRYTPGRFVITYTKKYGFKRDVKTNIKADDVIHIFKNGVIVKQDAKVEDKLTKTYVDKYGENVVLGSGDSTTEAWLNSNPFASVYSYEEKEYRTVKVRRDKDNKIIPESRRYDLDPMKGRNVKALIAIDESLQLITSDLKISGGVAGINSIRSAGEVRFLPSKGDMYQGYETFDTEYYTDKGSLNKTLLDAFKVDDLVFTAVSKNEKTDRDEIEVMYLLKEAAKYTKEFESADLNSYYLNIPSLKKHYRYNDSEVNAFAWSATRGLYQVDIAKLVRSEKDNKELKAFVMSDAEVRKIVEEDNKRRLYHFISNDPNMANIVVFTGLKTVQDSEFRYAEVIRKDNYSTVIEVRYANNRDYKNAKDEIIRTQELNINRKDVSKIVVGDIVALGIDKESLKEIDGKMPKLNSINVVIPKNAPALRIKKVDYGTSIIFEGEDRTYYTRFADEFGDSRYAYAQKYQHKDKPAYDDYLTVIRYMPTGDAPQMDNIITFINKAEKTITVDGKRAYVLDEFIELTKDGKLYKGYTAAVNQLMVGDHVLYLRQDSNGRVFKLEVETMIPPMTEKAKALVAKVPTLETEYQALKASTNKDEWKAFAAKLMGVKAEFDALNDNDKSYPEVKTAMEALAKMIKEVNDKIASMPDPENPEIKKIMDEITALVATDLTGKDKAALEALKAEAEALKVRYNALSDADKAKVTNFAELEAFITKVQAAIDALAPTVVTATAVCDTTMSLAGQVGVKITLVGAKAKDVDPASVKVLKADGSEITYAGLDAAKLAANETDNFGVLIPKKEAVAGITVEFMVNGNKVTATVTIK